MATEDRFGAAKDHTFLGNLKFKAKEYEPADEHFKQAMEIFMALKNTVNLVQLYMTVARLNMTESRKEPCIEYLDKAEEMAKTLGEPEKLTSSIAKMRKMLERIDKK